MNSNRNTPKMRENQKKKKEQKHRVENAAMNKLDPNMHLKISSAKISFIQTHP